MRPSRLLREAQPPNLQTKDQFRNRELREKAYPFRATRGGTADTADEHLARDGKPPGMPAQFRNRRGSVDLNWPVKPIYSGDLQTFRLWHGECDRGSGVRRKVFERKCPC